MKEIKVRLCQHMDDNYNELYQVLKGDTKIKYFARHCYHDDGIWYYVSDPFGYCELDHSCPEDYIFVVCDSEGKELFKDSNGQAVKNPFPSLVRKAKLVWDSVRNKYPLVEGLNDWLLSFLTQEVLSTKLKSANCPFENWSYSWSVEVGKEIIERFEHLGERYCIYKITRNHKYCECEWVEYYAGPEEMEEYTGYIKYYGAWYDESKVGGAYSKRVACELVESALKEIYPGRNSLSRIKWTYWGDMKESKYSLRGAADLLIGGNRDRDYVEAVIKNEKNNPSFYTGRESIIRDFGKDVSWDYGYSEFRR